MLRKHFSAKLLSCSVTLNVLIYVGSTYRKLSQDNHSRHRKPFKSCGQEKKRAELIVHTVLGDM
jgi:hypothetical protein